MIELWSIAPGQLYASGTVTVDVDTGMEKQTFVGLGMPTLHIGKCLCFIKQRDIDGKTCYLWIILCVLYVSEYVYVCIQPRKTDIDTLKMMVW